MTVCKALVSMLLCFILSGPNVNAQEKTQLSKEAIVKGSSEYHKMLTARPVMATWKLRNSFLDRWAVERFAGKGSGGLIQWNDEKLENSSKEYNAESSWNNGKPYIRIRQGNSLDTPESLWAAFVFECFNVQNCQRHNAVAKMAEAGDLTRAQFIEGHTRVEYDTLLKTAQFYNKFIAPMARSKKVLVHPNLWHANVNDSYEAWIRLYNDPNYYPFNSFGTYYDQYIQPIKSVKDFGKKY